MKWGEVEFALRAILNALSHGWPLPPVIDRLIDDVAHARSQKLLANPCIEGTPIMGGDGMQDP